MKTFLFVGLLLSSASFAETFKIAGSLHPFQVKDGLLVKGCEKECRAIKVVESHKKIDLNKVREGQKFDNSVGSDVCAKLYKVNSVLGEAKNRDRRAFCVFEDGSMIEMNSLSKYLTDRKIAQ